MSKLEIKRGNNELPSIIYFEKGFERLFELAPIESSVIITNESILDFYGKELKGYRIITIAEGEAHKTMKTVEQIHRELLEMQADRSLRLVGFGGGIVTDITGFVASTYMRGVKFGFVATSLLAQVDASVGGKNGVNLDGYKNIIGTFNQPDWVLCPYDVLETLPEDELHAGFSEIIKCGLLRNTELFGMFENPQELNLEKAIIESVKIKAKVVENDEREAGERKLLNLGHTFAHAIEKCSNGQYLHGEAVAIGLVMAAQMSVNMGLMSECDKQRIERTIEQNGLPTAAPEISKTNLIKAMVSDKKQEKGSIDFILLKGIANPVIQKIAVENIEKFI